MQLQKTIFHEVEGGLCGLKVRTFLKLWKKNISSCNKLKIVEAWSSKSFSGEALVKKINDTVEILLELANAGRREWGDAHKSAQKMAVFHFTNEMKKGGKITNAKIIVSLFQHCFAI